MSHVADTILHLHGWVALLVIFAVPALEASAFLGVIFPGEIAVLLGGVLAFQHKVSLPAALAAAVAGAVIGDTIGFEVGKRWGRQILHGALRSSPLVRVLKEEHLTRAEHYLAERGGKAVFIGRFTAALRALIPSLAGMAGMPYPTFAAYNIAGGTIWGAGFIIAGYVAGDGYKRFEHVAKQASIVVLLAAIVAVAVVFAARRAIRQRDRVEAFGRRVLDRPAVARWRTRFSHQLDFLARRLRPSGALGLELTVALVALVLAGWAFGSVVAAVLARGKLVGIDGPVLDFFARHRTAGLTDVVRVLTTLGSAIVIVPLTAVVGLGARWSKHPTWRPLLVLGGAYGGAAVIAEVVKVLVARSRPPAALAAGHFRGYSFPSGHATQAAAFWGALAVVSSMATPSWRRRVLAATAAILVTMLVGTTRCYLGAHWASDVLGGWAAGSLWLCVVIALSQGLRAVDPGGSAPAGADHVPPLPLDNDN